ncbi:MAG: Glu/Leu/Phe/Val dehydrogenase dimerization domain-containing protein [Thermodesulfobacteriota bacterium]|nr:Glu/Leu/Phe/Val dehydrogenase dimerization domain-containing protein [Thermodesulfobacteriota bacterium]
MEESLTEYQDDIMMNSVQEKPELVVEYVDPEEGFKGWLAIDCFDHELCAGGVRVQKGLTRECVENLASTMTLKMRIAGIRADGAKCGIDYDPSSPGKNEALFRFVRAIRPYICTRYSMGPDMNTTMQELDSIVSRLGLPSMKVAVAYAQGFEAEDFLQRIKTLAQPAGNDDLGRLRAGSGLAAACFGVLDHLDIYSEDATVTIQGFGGLASGAAYCLSKKGVNIIALADRKKSFISPDKSPLHIKRLLQKSTDGLIPGNEITGVYEDRNGIYNVPCDVFVPAAIEKAITAKEAAVMQVKAVVCGANLAVTAEAEHILHERGILLIPDLIAGCGGSLSMEGLFGPSSHPTVEDVLQFVDEKMRRIVKTTLERSQADNIPTRDAAIKICRERSVHPGTKPYGSLDISENILQSQLGAYQPMAMN